MELRHIFSRLAPTLRLCLITTALTAGTLSCSAQTGPGNCGTNTLVGNSGGGLTCLTNPLLGQPFVGTTNYNASNGQTTGMQIVLGSLATPVPLSDAPVIFEKFSNNTGTGSTINSTLYVAIGKTVTCSGCRATAIFSEAQDTVGGANSFVEGGRFVGSLGVSNNGQAFGVICVGGTNSSVSYTYIVGCESDVLNNSGTNATTSFSSAKFVASFLATCSQGTNKCDAGFLVNPFGSPSFIYGMMVPNGSIDSTGTAFYSNATATNGLDLSLGTFSFAAIAIPNNTPVTALNAAGSTNLNIMYLNASNQLIMGQGTPTPGISCGPGVNGTTVVVVGGIVTHC